MIENIIRQDITDKEKIDKLLEFDCNMYTNLGTDSTKTEKLEVKRMSKKIYKAIQGINEAIGKSLLQSMDK
jgi:ribosomal protein S6